MEKDFINIIIKINIKEIFITIEIMEKGFRNMIIGINIKVIFKKTEQMKKGFKKIIIMKINTKKIFKRIE